ncbi:MAG: TonB-dependent receptor [Bacteroidales bacterium]|nr:TonB-dependent receptor [Bacteroidales bacterium]
MKFNLKKALMLAALCLTAPFFANAQNITVSGTVTDKSGETVIGAAVMVSNSSVGAVTGVDGTYSLQVSPSATLEISCMGYTTQRVPVQGRSTINIVLSDDAQALDAIVVIGYGSARKTDVTGSIASMGGDNLREVAAGDFSRSLNGRVAGVQMSQTNSRPGASLEIRIRGDRSLSASNDPLIVLDGVPFMGSLSDIATGDIKSMDILKDASSTAIYGSRGANGVILITTYKGVSGQAPKVTFNNYIGFKNAIKYPMMNGAEFAKMRALAGKYTNKIGYEDDKTDTDWQDLFYRTGIVRNHELSVVGGTMKGSYRFSTAYYKDEAVVPTQDFDRISLSGSLDQSITDWFKVGFSTNTNYNRSHGNQLGLYGILQLTPILDPKSADDGVRAAMPLDNVWLPTRENIEKYSDRWVSENSGFASYNTGYVELRAPWVEGLSFKQTVGANFRTSKSGSFTGVGVNSFDVANPNSASSSQNQTINWTLESLLTYDRTFNEKHHINAVAMYSAEQTTYTQSGMSARNIPNEQFLYYNIGQANAEDITVSPNAANYWQAGLISYMGRVMYSYADRYMVSAAVRSDASSRLAKGHQWHTYPAVSLGWNLHNEAFMQGASGWLDELKLRVGYGETSNQAISPYQTLGSLGTRPYNFGDAYATGYYVSTLPNTELGWEYSDTWNFGIDFGFFNNRLNGTIEYYSQNTHDILLGLNLPSTAGVGSYTANIGSTQNRGIEISLNGTIIDTQDWKWDAGINIYANRNKLVSLASGQTEDRGNRWFVGMPINCLYDYEYDGLWQKGEEELMNILQPSATPGDIKVKYHGEYDASGKPVRAIDTNDQVPINADPNFLGGFNTRLQFRNWDLSIIGNFQCGGILISTLHGSSGYLNMLTGRRGQVKVDYWTESNTGARYPRPGGLNSNDNPLYGSTLGYFDGSFLKIGTITLGYNFDKISALRRAGIDKLRVYATAQNPFVLFSSFHSETGLDPEPNARGNDGSFQASAGYLYRQKVVGTNTPNTRNFIFGINLTF